MSFMSKGVISVLDPSGNIESRGEYNRQSADRHYAEGNCEKSFAINMISAKEGYAPCQYNVGYAYSKGEGVDKDMEQALIWYKKAAEQDLACAQHALAQLSFHYHIGDSDEAFRFLIKASDSGFPPSMHLLAVVLDNHKRHKEAFALYKKAAEAGFANSQHDLAICYLHGEGIAQDFDQAVFWLKAAANQGHEKAVELLKQL